MLIRFYDIPKVCLFVATVILFYNMSLSNEEAKEEGVRNNDDIQDIEASRDVSEGFYEDGLKGSPFTNMFLDYFNMDDGNEDKVESSRNNEIIHMSKLIDNYIQRYVNLFLKVSQLDVHKAVENEKLIKANLEIVLTPEELAFLQNYSKTGQASLPLQRVLTKLDGILGKMVRVKELSHLEWGAYVLRKVIPGGFGDPVIEFWELFNRAVHIMLHNPYLLIFFVSVSVACLIFPFNSFKNVTYAVFIAGNIIILFESYWHYQGKIDKLKFESLTLEKPDYCDSSKSKWYYGILRYFAGDSCYEYYRKTVRDPAVEVSLLQSVIDTYAFYAVEKPLHILGKSFHHLAKQFTSDLPGPIRWFLQLFVTHTIVVIGAFVILILCGINLKLSFFGTSLQFGKSRSRHDSIAPALSTVKAAEKALAS